MKLICKGCRGLRNPRQYLCGNCWWLLRPWVRAALNKRDDLSMLRLKQLYKAIEERLPLEDVEVTR